MAKKFKQRPLFAQNLPKEVTKPRIHWTLLPIIWRALKRTATVLGFVLIFQFFVALIVLPALIPSSNSPSLPGKMVLYLTLDDNVAETPKEVSLADPFTPSALTLRQITDALHRAADDDRIKAFVLRINSGGAGVSAVSEIHDALRHFKRNGKKAYVYSSSYGESGAGLSSYYLASAFDEIWMQPMGVVSIAGLSAQIPYIRETLDKIGVRPQFFQRKDYKTAYESMTNRSITPENKEMMERLIGDLRDILVSEISANRDMQSTDFSALVDRGLLTAKEAEDAGIITHADYADVLVDNIKEDVTGQRDGPDELFVDFRKYVQATQVPQMGLAGFGGNKIALIYAVGAIMPGSGKGGFPTDGVAAADEIAPAILEAADDDSVKAIVLRIDSPGGSPTASESILRAVEKAQQKGKKVVVSMGGTAASGGYWIAAYADRIFVLPSTITGSIGVVGGKFSLAGLWDKVGVNWEEISWGRNSGMWSFNEPFSKSEAERFNAMLDNVYDNFIARVAKGRGMDPEDVDKIAGGRVWTGKRAIENGLADEFGGLDAALDYAAVQAGYKSRKDVNVVVMPRPKTAFEQLVLMLDGQVQLGQFMRENKALLGWLEPIAGVATRAQNPNDFMVYQDLSLR